MGDTIKSFPVPSPFPFLSPAKFDEACRKIQTLWSEQGAAQDRGEWESVQIVRRVSKRTAAQPNQVHVAHDCEERHALPQRCQTTLAPQ